ncbi:MAG: GNAT family N-acetyltransferase [Anaerolineae bacterium]|nr:GNAT family N-acetyltransferase [Anaerolineae bacterium]
MTTATMTNNGLKTETLTFRPGRLEDLYAIYCIFEETLADLIKRFGSSATTSWHDPVAMEKIWQERRPLFEHLARTAAQFWIAEYNGEPVGYARSIFRDGLCELTDFFVKPDAQSLGAGRGLMERTFPVEGTTRKNIIATTDMRAQRLYMRYGVVPRFLIYYFGREPEVTSVETDLVFERVTVEPETLDRLAAIDHAIIEHRRDDDHAWLLDQREGYLYYRDGRPVGYGYLGANNGPFALLDPADYPAVLAHAESEAARQGREFGLEVPTINLTAVEYLIARGFRLDSFAAVFMSDKPYGKFENYIITSPPFFF